MADLNQTIPLPEGSLTVTTKGGNINFRVKYREQQFEETSAGIANQKELVNRLGPKDKLQVNDIISFSYADGPGYAEVVTASNNGKGLKAVGPSGVEKNRDHLLANSTYNPETQTFTYNGTWDPKYTGMTFTISRSKSSGAVEGNSGAGGETKVDKPNQGGQGANRPSPKAEKEFNDHVSRSSAEYNRVLQIVQKKQEALTAENPTTKYPTRESRSGANEPAWGAALTNWRKPGGLNDQLNATVAAQKELEGYLKTTKAAVADAKTIDSKEGVLVEFDKAIANFKAKNGIGNATETSSTRDVERTPQTRSTPQLPQRTVPTATNEDLGKRVGQLDSEYQRLTKQVKQKIDEVAAKDPYKVYPTRESRSGANEPAWGAALTDWRKPNGGQAQLNSWNSANEALNTRYTKMMNEYKEATSNDKRVTLLARAEAEINLFKKQYGFSN